MRSQKRKGVRIWMHLFLAWILLAGCFWFYIVVYRSVNEPVTWLNVQILHRLFTLSREIRQILTGYMSFFRGHGEASFGGAKLWHICHSGAESRKDRR